MTKLGFFLMNRRGYEVIKSFVAVHGSSPINYVVGSADNNVKQDWFYEIKDFCINNKINWIERNKYNDFDFTEDYKLAIGWRWIINRSENLIVLHDSLLPKYRGFAPLVNMLINGESLLGVTALLATDEYDKGDLIIQKSFSIKYPLKISDAIELISPLYSEIVIELYSRIRNNRLSFEPQDHLLSTYSPWLDEKDYFIDWSWSADKVVRFVNAVGFPFDGAKAILNGEVVNIIEAEHAGDAVVEHRNRHIGKVIFLSEQMPVIICGEGLLKVILLSDKLGNPVPVKFRSRFE